MNTTEAERCLSPGFDPYVGFSDTGRLAWTKRVSRAAKRTVRKTVAPVVRKAIPIAQTVLKNSGPIGMVASGTLGAMQAGLSGKSIEKIAWAAAKGAAPSGIDRAIDAAQAIREGKNVVSVALSQAAQSFVPGTPEKLGFETAVAVLKESASKAALGEARRALPNEGAKRAFDAAIGVASETVKGTPLASRAMSIPNIKLEKVRGSISAMTPAMEQAVNTLKRNPSLLSQDRIALARRLGTSPQVVNDAIRRVGQSAIRTRILPWRAMSGAAASFLRRYVPTAPMNALRLVGSDTQGLDATGTKYIVEKGDYPILIAKKLTGDGNRYRELHAANPQKKIATEGQFKGSFATLYAGEVLNLPLSWQKPVSAPAPVATAPTVTSVPTASKPELIPTGVIQGVLQGKVILAAWNQTDGANAAGPTDYGQRPEDLSTSWGPRDTLVCKSFQNWSNKLGNPLLNTDGVLDSATLVALQAWAEAKAKAAGVALPVPLPTMAPIPGEVPSPGQPTTVSLPFPMDGGPVEVVPELIITGEAPTPPVPASGEAVPVVAKKSGSAMPMLLGGIGGAIVGGPVGMAFGAIGGAALSGAKS